MGKILVLCKGFVTDLKVLVLVEVLLVVRIFLITVISDFIEVISVSREVM